MISRKEALFDGLRRRSGGPHQKNSGAKRRNDRQRLLKEWRG